MIKAASEIRQRCLNHPHRRAVRQCYRCRRGLCEACVQATDQQPICDTCRLELAELHRINHVPAAERVRRVGVSFRNALIGLAVLGILAIPASYVVRNLMSTPISPEEFARFRYAASGSFETPEGVNPLSTVLNGRVVSATSEQPDHPARRLIDEYAGPAFPGWRSADATFPQEIIFETGQPTRIEKLTLQLQPDEPPDTAPREIEVAVSTVSPDGPYQSVGRFVVEPTDEIQRFPIPPTDTRWIRLRILANRGGPYVALAEFNVWVLPKGPFGATPEPTQPRR